MSVNGDAHAAPAKALADVKVLGYDARPGRPCAPRSWPGLGCGRDQVELPGDGDITRGQLRDLPKVDSLYFTMLNCNKAQHHAHTKSADGKAIFTKADPTLRRAGRELRTGAARQPGFHLGEDPARSTRG